MTEPHRCPHCGKPLPQNDALVGRCPFCLLQRGFESDAGNGEGFESAVGPPDPAAIGRYRVLRRIGEGGMGVVYEAEQDHPRRTVALKIIKSGMASPELLRRFEQESQALGRLQHTGIAQIYEAGTVDTGFGPQPYFAMEFIRGKAPREYAESNQLGTRERLEIMAKICDAVHHAHQRGLIHRDLKPGNILIDESGQPKILDFGVARVTDSDARATIQTDMGQLIGTLAYMSPEQVLADPMDIDTRSDVYSLGVILYEFLSGRLPYPISKKIHETIQSIREEDPAKLSGVSRTFRGDIETIVAKALEKDRMRRYASAAEMAADILRYLKDEPIVARPPSAIYQLQKFASRNKALVSGIAAVLALLVAGTAAISWQERKAVRERDRALEAGERALRAEHATTLERDQLVVAEEQARNERDTAVSERIRANRQGDTAKALSDFLRNNLLTFPDPRNGTPLAKLVKPNPDLTVREVLDRAVASIAGKFDAEPLVEADVREAIATSYLRLGLYAEGQKQSVRAVELHRSAQGRTHPDTLKALKALLDLSVNAQFSVSYVEALQKEIVDIEIQTLGKENPQTLMDKEHLLTLYRSDQNFAKAEPLLVDIIAAQSRIGGAPDLTSVRYAVYLIECYEKQGKSNQARQAMEKLEAEFRVLGEDSNITQAGLGMLTELYLDNFWTRPEAEKLFNRTLASQLSKLSSLSSLDRISAMISLVRAYQQLGKTEQADQLSVMVEANLRGLGEKNPMMISGINTFKLKTHRSLPDLVDLVNSALPRPGTESLRDLTMIRQVALAYYEQGKFREAESLYKRAVNVSDRLLALEDPDSLSGKLALAGLYVLEGKYDQGEGDFTKLLNINRRASGLEARITLFNNTLLGWTHLHQQKFTEVEADLREVLSALEKTQPDEWERYNCQSVLGASLAGQKKYSEAEALLLSAYEGMTTKQSTVSRPYPLRPKLQEEGGERIVQLYLDWGKPEKAADWREKLRSAEALWLLGPPRK